MPETDFTDIRIYFHCYRPGAPDHAAYQHDLVCLAEGLAELGVPCFASRDYWRKSIGQADYLLRHDSRVRPEDCDIVVADHFWVMYGKGPPDGMLDRNRSYRAVYMDGAFGHPTFSWNEGARDFDVILRSHYNSKFRNPPNMKPWAFGLSDRIMRYTQETWSPRRRAILINFRYPHELRQLVKREILDNLTDVLPQYTITDSYEGGDFDPIDRLFWEQTGRRHYPEFYRRLTSFLSSFCVGGFNLPPLLRSSPRWQRVWKKLTGVVYVSSGMIAQFDSWRFWESLSAGCTAVHLDLKKYGLTLPVMPENGKHYIGVDLMRPRATVRKIRERIEDFETIGSTGRTWALTHYAPVPTALRFLKTVLA